MSQKILNYYFLESRFELGFREGVKYENNSERPEDALAVKKGETLTH